MRSILSDIFRPKLLDTLKGYGREQLGADVMSGVIVGIVALPLAIAFGIASGVTPEKGLITAVIAGFIISLLGGSRVQIGGPTGAFIVIVYGIVQQFGTSGLIVATIMAGVMLVAMGLLRLGTIIRFIPYPVVVGFTSGIALTIFATQVNDFLGLGLADVPAEFTDKWALYGQHILDFKFQSVGLRDRDRHDRHNNADAAGVEKSSRVARGDSGDDFCRLDPARILRYFGHRDYWGQVFAGGNECGRGGSADRFCNGADAASRRLHHRDAGGYRVATFGDRGRRCDGRTGDRHNSNTELIAQGAANIITPFFGGIPATGAIARTMTNINNGGRTPVAGLVHAVVLLLITLFLGSLTRHIPMACLAGILVVVAYNMSEWRGFLALVKGEKAAAAVLVATFVLTVLFDLTVAIQIGLLMAVVIFIKRVSDSSTVSAFRQQVAGNDYVEGGVDSEQLELPARVEVYEIEGPFFFGIAGKFDEVMKILGDRPLVRIIRMRKVPFVDSTGAHNLRNLIKMSHREGITILLSGVNEGVRNTLKINGIEELVGRENVLSNINQAIERARQLTDG